MTDPNKLDTALADKQVDDGSIESLATPSINQQQVSIKAWSQKLLVILLCGASFYGGWKSHESSMVNECFASGGQIVKHGKTILCEIS